MNISEKNASNNHSVSAKSSSKSNVTDNTSTPTRSSKSNTNGAEDLPKQSLSFQSKKNLSTPSTENKYSHISYTNTPPTNSNVRLNTHNSGKYLNLFD